MIKRGQRQPKSMIRAAEQPNADIGRPPTSDQSSPVDIQPESSLIQQTREGSHSAFAELIRRNHVAVRVVLGRYSRDNDEVDELAQRAFIAAFHAIDQFRGDAKFGSWLVAIARRQAAMYVREENRRRKHELTAGERALQAWAESSQQGAEDLPDRLATLAECLQMLPPHSHDIVTGYYFDRQSIEDIALTQGRSKGSIRMLLVRIRRSLAKCISQRFVQDRVQP